MNPWIHVTGWTLIHFVWQGAVLAVLTAAVLRLCRYRSPETRYVIACGSLGAMLVSAGVTVATVWAPGPTFSDANAVAAALNVAATVTPFSDEASRIRPDTFDLNALLPVLVWTWLAGVAFFLVRFSAGWWRIHRLRLAAMAEAASAWQTTGERLARRLGVHAILRVVESRLVQAPTLIGWMRPMILLPAAFLANLTPGQIEALLAHEVAHIRRHDYAVNLLQTLTESLLFFHPAVWWVSSRIRQEREHSCDDVVVKLCGEPVSYAEALAELASWRTRGAALAVGAADGPLLQRIRRLLRVPAHDEPRALSGFVLSSVGMLVAGALVLLLGPSLAGSEARTSKIQSGSSDWRVRQSDHFEIHYPQELDLHAERVAQEAERGHERVSLDLRHNLAFRVPVVLYHTTSEVEQASQGRRSTPPHIGSSADPSRERILLAVDRPADQWFGILTHELTHVFVFDIIPGEGTPPWIMEGLAEYQRGAWDPDDLVALRRAVRDNALPRITSWRPEDASRSSRFVHAMGHAAFDYIESRWGKPGMRQFLLALRQAALKGDDPYQRALRITGDEFDRGLEEYLTARFAGVADRFDHGASLRVEGEITALRSPIPAGLACIELWVHGNGKSETWAVECDDTAMRGLPGALKPGDRVIVVGAPARIPGTQRLALRRLARPSDGFTWSGDSRELASTVGRGAHRQ
jgi:beta-lactamase regulating signal transducer with metallopeptidase domain